MYMAWRVSQWESGHTALRMQSRQEGALCRHRRCSTHMLSRRRPTQQAACLVAAAVATLAMVTAVVVFWVAQPQPRSAEQAWRLQDRLAVCPGGKAQQAMALQQYRGPLISSLTEASCSPAPPKHTHHHSSRCCYHPTPTRCSLLTTMACPSHTLCILPLGVGLKVGLPTSAVRTSRMDWG